MGEGVQREDGRLLLLACRQVEEPERAWRNTADRPFDPLGCRL
jgi:hypothetical protein